MDTVTYRVYRIELGDTNRTTYRFVSLTESGNGDIEDIAYILSNKAAVYNTEGAKFEIIFSPLVDIEYFPEQLPYFCFPLMEEEKRAFWEEFSEGL